MKQEETKSSSSTTSAMDTLIDQLNIQLNRYDTVLTSIYKSRCSVQEPMGNELKAKENSNVISTYYPGKLARLDSLIGRLKDLNTDAESEAAFLREYL